MNEKKHSMSEHDKREMTVRMCVRALVKVSKMRDIVKMQGGGRKEDECVNDLMMMKERMCNVAFVFSTAFVLCVMSHCY